MAWSISDIYWSPDTNPKHYHQRTTYVEQPRKEYSIRISNPLGVCVAVALSVDGLNTINAQHTEPGWKLGLSTYESIVIDGWQVNSQQPAGSTLQMKRNPMALGWAGPRISELSAQLFQRTATAGNKAHG
jgi:hypothetical protein